MNNSLNKVARCCLLISIVVNLPCAIAADSIKDEIRERLRQRIDAEINEEEIAGKLELPWPIVTSDKTLDEIKAEVRERVAAQVEQNFPDEADRKARYEQEAAEKYPLLKRGDEGVAALIKGGAIRGRLWEVGPRHVKLGDRIVNKLDIVPESLATFDQDANREVRDKYVQVQLLGDRNEQEAHGRKIRDDIEQEVYASHHYVLYRQRWTPAAELLERYVNALRKRLLAKYKDEVIAAVFTEHGYQLVDGKWQLPAAPVTAAEATPTADDGDWGAPAAEPARPEARPPAPGGAPGMPDAPPERRPPPSQPQASPASQQAPNPAPKPNPDAPAPPAPAISEDGFFVDDESVFERVALDSDESVSDESGEPQPDQKVRRAPTRRPAVQRVQELDDERGIFMTIPEEIMDEAAEPEVETRKVLPDFFEDRDEQRADNARQAAVNTAVSDVKAAFNPDEIEVGWEVKDEPPPRRRFGMLSLLIGLIGYLISVAISAGALWVGGKLTGVRASLLACALASVVGQLAYKLPLLLMGGMFGSYVGGMVGYFATCFALYKWTDADGMADVVFMVAIAFATVVVLQIVLMSEIASRFM